jgi:ribosomal protein RSM22 (predicted rRNA methylase)
MTTSNLMPDSVRAALAERLDRRSRGALGVSSAKTSDAYRRGDGTASIIRSADDALAYASVRMPATYAAVRAALATASRHLPLEAKAPISLVDVGAGTGAATIAAIDAWRSITDATMIETNAAMAALGRDLIASIGIMPRLDTRDVTSKRPLPIADLVVMSYVLVELTAATAAQVVQSCLAAANQTLVMVEPGTSAGFARIRSARDQIIAAGWSIVAPCPHATACPLVDPDWCHFKVRLPRTRAHMQIKGASVPFEDEPYALMIATHAKATPATARILRAPDISKGDVRIRLCKPGGAADHIVPRKHPDFKAARKADAGDTWGDT